MPIKLGLLSKAEPYPNRTLRRARTGEQIQAMAEDFFPTVFLAMTIGVALICGGLVARGCIARGQWPSHSLALIYFFVIAAIEAVEQLNQTLPSQLQIPWLSGATLLVVPSLGACIWFYVRGLTSKDDRFVSKDLWHLAPIAMCIFGALPFLLSSDARQGKIMTSQADMTDTVNLAVVICLLLAWIIWIAMLVLYSGATISRLLSHRRKIKDLYSSVEGVSLGWLHGLILIVVIFATLVLVSSVLPAFSDETLFPFWMVAVFYFFVVLVVGLFGVLQHNTIPSWNQLENEVQPSQRYARSALRPQDSARIAKKLDEAMQTAELWQNPNLSLLDIANETGASQNNISQTLNEHLGVNFYDYVNSWRIKAACHSLAKTDQSVLTIAHDVGFNAKSTFNAAFKKVTGQTPRQYRNAMLEAEMVVQQ